MNDVEPASQEPQGRIDLLQFGVTALLRFHLLIVLGAMVGVGVGLFRGVATPNQYSSLGKLFVYPSARESVTVESVISGDGARSHQIGLREAINNELQVLTSPRLWEMVVDRVGVETLTAPYDPGNEGGGSWTTSLFHGFQSWWFRTNASGPEGQAADAWAATLLRDTVAIYPETNASVINIEHTAHSPELAKKVVDAVLESARDLHGEVFSALESLGTVEAELQSAEQMARAAEDTLREFRVEHRIYDFEAQRLSLMDYLGDIDRRIDTAELETKSHKAERDVLIALLEDVPEFLPLENGQVTLNPDYTGLTAYLRQLEQYILENERRAGTIDKRIYEKEKELLAAEMERTKLALQKEDRILVMVTSRLEHPRRARCVENLDSVEVALRRLEEQRAQLLLSRTGMQEQLRALDALSPRLRQLELDARQKRTTADRLAEGLTSLKNVQRLNQLKLSNVKILHAGSYDRVKIAPLRSRLLMLGVVGGTAFGVALALGLAFLDRRVRSRLDLQRAGVADAQILVSRRLAGAEAAGPLAEDRLDVERFWRKVGLGPRDERGLKIAVLPVNASAEAGRTAFAFAVGLCVHGGRRAVLVAADDRTSRFVGRCGWAGSPGWREVLRGEVSLAAALQDTSLAGLRYLPAGEATDSPPDALDVPGLTELIDRLAAEKRVVVVALPFHERNPAAIGVLRGTDGAVLVARVRDAVRKEVQDALAEVESSGAVLTAVVLQPATSEVPGETGSS